MLLMEQLGLSHIFLFGLLTMTIVVGSLLIWPEHLALEAEARRLEIKH